MLHISESLIFNSKTSRYLDESLSIDNIHFEQMVHRKYSAELQLIKANTSDTEEPFADFNLSIGNGIKFQQKMDDFYFAKVNFPFLDGDVPRRPSYGVYISQLIRFARASSHYHDFISRNKLNRRAQS